MAYGQRTIVLFEIDQPLCSLLYGESPCAAVLGVTGTRKCYNTLATCQDQENFTPGTLTLRFARDDDRLPLEYGPLFASLEEVSTRPGRINIGGMEDSSAAFGQRETITVRLRDFRWSDHLVDKSRLERTFVAGDRIPGYAMPRLAYPTFGARARARPELELAIGDFLGYDDPVLSPYKRGTFWSRWVARNPYYSAMNCRVYEGSAGQTIDEMRVRHYVIEQVAGPNDGTVTITAADVFSKIEERKALAPFLSIGDLDGAITGTPATFDVTTGAGDLTPREGGYSTITNVVPGWVAIGRRECLKVTRVGDTFTVVGRGELGTTAVDHEDGDSVQLVLAIEAELGHDAAYNLITGYTEVSAELIDKPEWDVLAAESPEQFTGYIAEPTPVSDLLAELEVNGGFTLWPDVSTGMVRYAPLRAGTVSPSVTDRGWIVGTPDVKRRDDKRISQVVVYYVKRSALSELAEPNSYAARIITPGPGSSPYGSEVVRKVFSRFIPAGGRETARKLGERIFAMYENPPIEARFSQDVSRSGELEVATYFSLETAEVQDDVGDVLPVAMTPLSIRRGENVEDVEAMSVRFSQSSEDGVRRIFIDTDEFNINLRTLHDQQYAAPVGDEQIEFIFAAGVRVGSTSAGSPAVRTGSWPSMTIQPLITFADPGVGAKGRIQGKGGAAGNGGSAYDGGGFIVTENGGNGENGGDALLVEVPFQIDDDDGELFGGGAGSGGGGAACFDTGPPFFFLQTFGGAAAGAGAGTNPGASASGGTGADGSGTGSSSAATAEAGGNPGSPAAFAGSAFAGAAPGQDGTNGLPGGGNFQNGSGGIGGTRGKYISGIAFVTFLGGSGDRRGAVS